MKSKKKYMLDTNMASYVIKNKSPNLKSILIEKPMACLYISVITEAKLLLGVAKKTNAPNLSRVVNEFLARVNILPWDSLCASTYSKLRATTEKNGKSLSAMDMLIAAHAVSADMILVTNDQAFFKLTDHIQLEDWTDVPVETK